MTHTQKKAPLRSFFAKMTLQWRLTALTTLLVTVACIFMYFFISHSAVSGMDDLHDYAIHIDQNDSSPITFQVDPSMLFPQINDQLAQTKQLFMIKSLAVTIVVILISSLSTWFLTRKSLAPLRSLSKKISDIQAQNLSVSIDVPESHDEISKLTEAFNQMLVRLNNAFDVQKQFSANAAHELRTPLTSINGFVQGILDGTIPASEQRRYLEIVLAESQRLSRLTREMLDLSRIESGKYKISKAVFDINELLRRVIITLGDKLEEKEIDFVADFKEERICVAADAGCIEQVCVNLMDNAIKFTDKGKNITVTSEIVGGKARITIADEGKGISKEDLAHIWDRFYTENKSRSGNSGMGLGLSIVKRLLAEHGEDINVESEPGKGTAFSFELELAPKGSGAMKL